MRDSLNERAYPVFFFFFFFFFFVLFFHLLKTLLRVLSGKHAQGQENKLLIFHLRLGLWLSEGQKKRQLLLFKTKEPLFLQKKKKKKKKLQQFYLASLKIGELQQCTANCSIFNLCLNCSLRDALM